MPRVAVAVAVLCLWPAVAISQVKRAERQPAGSSAIFERFTEQARRVLYFARAAVSEYGSAELEPEHVLLGILREGKGAAFDLLFNRFQLDPASLSKEIESRLERKATFSESVEVPFSRFARRVITASVEEADRLGDREIDTEHLLLGVLRVSDSIPASMLAKHGVTLELARQQLKARNP
jgi:ATP-dependent Clp protease ATP-binding subunit ClpC